MRPDQTQTGGGSGSGSGGGSSQGGGTTVVVQREGGGDSTESRTQRRTDAVQGITDRLVAKYGTLEAALTVLAGENYEYRDTLRAQSDELASLRKKVPADGALVLTADQKKVWDAIVASGVPIEKVAERIKRAGELETQLAEADFVRLVDEGAATMKYNATVLRSLLKDKGYTLEVRDMLQADGKTIKFPFVRKAGDDKAAWEKLDVAAERDFKEFLPALKANPQGGNAGGGGGSSATGTSSVSHEMPTQSSSASSQGGGNGTSVVDQQIARNKSRSEKPNPLRPAAAAAKK